MSMTHPTTRRPVSSLRRVWFQAFTVMLLTVPAVVRATDYTYSWGHPRPQGNTVFAIAFADAAHGWAVGGSGFVLRTLDGGEHWDLQHGPRAIASDLFDLVVTPSGALLACGTGDGLYRSTDGGVTWTSPPHPPAAGLRDLAMRPDGAVSAAGENGVVLLSGDDGLTWSSIGPGTGTIRHHAWRTTTEAYVVGQGVSHRTTNTGTTWTQFVPEEFFGYNEVYFTDALHGYVVEDFATWSTTNGGGSWVEDFNPTPPLYRYRTLVLSPAHWLVVCHGEGGELWETTNAGTDWTEHLFTGSVGFPCIHQAPGGRVHFGSDTGDLYRTDDLGLTIENATENLGAGAIGARILLLVARPDGVLFSANQPSNFGEPNAWLRSDNGGATWFPPAASPDLNWIIDGGFYDQLRGVTGEYEETRATLDGGKTWVPGTLPAGYRLSRFALPAADRYFAAAYGTSGGGAVFRSTDGGLIWNPAGGGLPLGPETFFDIAFPSPAVGFAGGMNAAQQPRLYRTLDGGVSWTLLSPAGLTAPIRAMTWFDTQIGVISQGYPEEEVLRTTNGGLTWTPVLAARPIRFVRRGTLEAVAIESYTSAFLHTADGGATWEAIQPPLSGPFPGSSDICTAAAPVSEGWVLGGGRNRLLRAIEESPASTPGLPPEDRAADVARSGPTLNASPNPFRPESGNDLSLRFDLRTAGEVRLEMCDIAGRQVREVIQGRREAGEHRAFWDGRDDDGRLVTAGVYFAKLAGEAGENAVRIVRVR